MNYQWITAASCGKLPLICGYNVDEKQLRIIAEKLLRLARGRSRNTFTAGNGHHSEETPGTREGPGNRDFARVAGTGGRPAVQGKPGNWPTSYGAADKAPSTSYVEGALLHSAGRRQFRQERHARILQSVICVTGGRHAARQRDLGPGGG